MVFPFSIKNVSPTGYFFFFFAYSFALEPSSAEVRVDSHSLFFRRGCKQERLGEEGGKRTGSTLKTTQGVLLIINLLKY